MSHTSFDEPDTIVVSIETPPVFDVEVFTDLTINNTGTQADQIILNPDLPGYGPTTQTALTEIVSTIDKWTSITSNTVATKNSRYIVDNTATNPIQIIIPTNATLGFEFSVLSSLGTYQITQNPGQQIKFGDILTTNGSGGGILSETEGDYLTVVCTRSPNSWSVISAIGNLTFF
jgi:hypothetical protein